MTGPCPEPTRRACLLWPDVRLARHVCDPQQTVFKDAGKSEEMVFMCDSPLVAAILEAGRSGTAPAILRSSSSTLPPLLLSIPVPTFDRVTQ